MGRFLNPDNTAFKEAINSKIYIDKSELINFTNQFINTQQKFICNSRPRRFGKSMAADMLLAYYNKNNDSKDIFSKLKIAKDPSFENHLNKYNVIYFDVQECIDNAEKAENVIEYITTNTISEIKTVYGEIIPANIKTLSESLSYINVATENQFVIIIDEWDALFRAEPKKTILHEKYIAFLRSLFKGAEARRFIALAYITGILPIKKYKTQSTLNNFMEYTMINPGPIAQYFGFTEPEVHQLCQKYNKDFKTIKYWYDGYILNKQHIYNPYAVANLIIQGIFQSYWLQSGTYESIKDLIQINFDGLRTDIISALAGNNIKVNPYFFQNDMDTFNDKNDVLALLIHLGYLAYDIAKGEAHIPNEEIRTEFKKATELVKWKDLTNLFKKSDELLKAIKEKNNNKVAEIIEQIHQENVSIIQYNDENSLSCIVTIAFLGTIDFYMKPTRELPAGKGYSDIVYLPKPEYINLYPALVIELKWNHDTRTAIDQIKEKQYSETIKDYTDNILLIGINYDKKSKKHTCQIEEYRKEE